MEELRCRYPEMSDAQRMKFCHEYWENLRRLMFDQPPEYWENLRRLMFDQP
jgi:lauroyl/myristoyl acyltransferase